MREEMRRSVNILALIGVSLAVVAAVISGILLIDSPAQERLHRLDERRIDDLQELVFAIDTYWSREGTLPATLEELSSDSRFLDEFVDPVSGQPYEYRVLGGTSYELCAEFSADGARDDRESPLWNLWEHGPGRECFVREARSPNHPIDRY